MICTVCKQPKDYMRLRHIGFHLNAVTQQFALEINGVCELCDRPKEVAMKQLALKVLQAPVTNDNEVWKISNG